MSSETSGQDRLESWKEVAHFFRKTERTVMRWEATRGLPIHRLPGQPRSRIFARVSELEDWRNSRSEVDLSYDAKPASTVRRLTPWLAAAGLAFFLGAGLAAVLVLKPPVRHAVIPAAARDLYDRGMADWQKRTPETLHAAIDEFDAAIRLAPDYAAAYAGLANCYNLSPEYTSMPASQAFPLARDAARRAIALDERNAGAHAALAFSLFYGFWDTKDAQKEYDRALQIEPDNATIQHWYATFLYTQRKLDMAITHINRALTLDPQSRSVAADRAIILYHAGRRDEAVAILTRMAAVDPDFRSPHAYLAIIYLDEGADADYIREAKIASRLTHNLYDQSLVEAAAEGLRKGGHQGMLHAMLANEEQRYRYGQGNAYDLAGTSAQLHDYDGAIAYLKIAFDRRDEDVIYLQVDERLRPLAGITGYQDIVARLQS